MLQKLLGEEFFTAMAGVFLRQHPPTSRLMMHYGTEMPDFLASFAPVAHLPYLPDVARLELALRLAYHAKDAPPLPADSLAALTPEAFLAARFRLAPTVQVIRSEWPLYAIWLANTEANAPKVQPGAQSIAITRPDFDPKINLLPPGGDLFIWALMQGQTIADAMTTAGDAHDLTVTLPILIAGGAFVEMIGEA